MADIRTVPPLPAAPQRPVRSGLRALLSACVLAALGLGCSALAAQPALAAGTYYVSTSGNDANAGSQTAPWRTIAKAAASVSGGASVHVAAGTYNERVTLGSGISGSAGAATRFVADGAVTVAQGFVVNSSYTELSGFTITPGASSGMAERVGQVDIGGDYDTCSGFTIADTAGPGFSVRSGASYDTITDFTITNPQWSGITTSDTYNSGADHTTISDGTIAHWRGWCGIELTGNDNLVQGVTLTGGPSGSNAPTYDGDGIRVNYATDAVIRDCHLNHIWEYYNSSQHCDDIQMWTHVTNLLIDRCSLGTWQPDPGYSHAILGPTQNLMVGTVPANDHVDFTAENCLFLGQTGTGAAIVTARDASSSIAIKLLNDTFMGARPSLNSCTSAYVRNCIFRNFNLYPANLAGVDSDYNLFLSDGGANVLSASEGGHSLGKTGAPSAASVFVNPDLSAATDYGVNADFHLKAGSVAIGTGEASAAPANDITGATRTSSVDMGAYAYSVATPTSPSAATGSTGAGATPTALTLSAKRTRFARSGRVTLRGKLTAAASAVAGRHAVVLYRSVDGGHKFARAATAAYNPATRTYVVKRTVRRTTVYRLHFAGGAGLAGGNSNVLAVTVRRSATRPALATVAASRRTVTLAVSTVTVGGRSVVFKAYRRAGRHWVHRGTWKAGSHTALASASGFATYSRNLRIAKGGVWRFVTVVHTRRATIFATPSLPIRLR